MIEFLKLFRFDSFTDLFTRFKFSWLTTGILSVNTGIWEKHLVPVISQLLLLLSLHCVALGVDYVRKRYKLPKRKDDDLNLPKNE